MMQPNRREFLKYMGWVTGTGLLGVQPALVSGDHEAEVSEDARGVLVDLSLCIGCRLCEHACKKSNGFEPGPVESYDDQSVFVEPRRPAPDSYTVINAYTNPKDPSKPVYVKSNCLHCNQPACVSACIVGALRKTEDGPVVYDAWKCIGCRYCMVACPFQIPAYDYDDPLTPQVRKCGLCMDHLEAGERPACISACPRETMIFGRRAELLELAREKIKTRPDVYVNHIYGEHEVGGTSWLYLSSVPFDQIGFLSLPNEAPPQLTESIQHGVFKFGLPPLLLYGMLGGLMYLTQPRETDEAVVVTEPDDADEIPVISCLQPEPEDEPQPPPVSVIENDEVHHHEEPMPVQRKFLTPGVMVLFGIALTGLIFGLKRFIFGLEAATNLDQQYPWGLWIGVDVASGVALAAGGFTTAFLAHVLHRERYHAITRPALLTAMLGYTFVVIGLQVDLGRYYNVWHPLFMWQGNSVLFEVGMCVMCYLTVLYLEFAPIVCERLMTLDRFPRVARLAKIAHFKLNKIMSLLIIAGCVLSCLHQSSLGTLMVIAPSKLHPLWWSSLLPLQFLLSAFAVGFPMAIAESLFAGRALKLRPEMEVLGPLGRFVPLTLGIYLAAKIGDMWWRGSYTYLGEGSLQSACWILEVAAGVVIPLIMFSSPRVRRSPRLLLVAASLVVLGVVFNRVNVFLVGYQPPYATRSYFPTIDEFAVTIGLIATLMICYRAIVTYFSVISQPKAKVAV